MDFYNIIVFSLIITFNFILPFTFGQKEMGDFALGCPRGTYKLDNYCYSVSSYRGTFDECELFCEMGSGKLAIVKNDKIHLFLHRLKLRQYMDFWIGVSDKIREGTWVYSDGSRIDGFSRWAFGEPNDAHSAQDCGKMQMTLGLQWDDDQCYKDYFYVCQFEGENCTQNNATATLGTVCFELSNSVAKYSEADKQCRQKGGYLANTKTLESYDFVRNLIYNDKWWMELSDSELDQMIAKNKNSDQSIVRIGLKYHEQKWILSDGTESNFTLWAPTKPSGNLNQAECVVMTDLWRNENCNRPRSCACQYSISSAISLEESLAESLALFGLAITNKSTVPSESVGALTIDQPSGMYLSSGNFILLLFIFLIIGAILVPCIGGITIYTRSIWRKKLKNNCDEQVLRILEDEA